MAMGRLIIDRPKDSSLFSLSATLVTLQPCTSLRANTIYSFATSLKFWETLTSKAMMSQVSNESRLGMFWKGPHWLLLIPVLLNMA